MRTACQEEYKANKTYRQFYRQLALPAVTISNLQRREAPLSTCNHFSEKAGVGGSTPSLATMFQRSSPETWVTECTGYIGNTFGPKGFSSGSSTRVSRSKYP